MSVYDVGKRPVCAECKEELAPAMLYLDGEAA